MKNDDFKHQLKGWVCKELWCMFLPLKNYYLKQLQSTLSESLPVIFAHCALLSHLDDSDGKSLVEEGAD